MDEMPVKKLSEIKREYMLRVLSEVNWDYRRASLILKVSEKFLRKQVSRSQSTPFSSK